MRKIDLIVIHCSATRENRDYTPQQLESDHRARGFSQAGYNFYIRRDGEVVDMRPLKMIPAHAEGYNRHSIGVCYEGGLDAWGGVADTRTPEQKDSLTLLVQELQAAFPGSRVCGHRDLTANKACPSFDAAAEYN
jgi:N-acetylmuramoyl-L-alanine amidase